MKTKYELFDEEFRKNMSYGCMRVGQATFNSVFSVDSEIANKLRGTEKDCFYFNDRTKAFMEEVYKKWAAEETN